MLLNNVIDKKRILNVNGEDIIDFTTSIFNTKKSNDLVFKLYRVPESMKMRIDLISYAAYGTDEYADILMKYNNISNPFTVNTDDILLVPTMDTIMTDIADVVSDNEYIEKMDNLKKYIDKNKVPKTVGSQINNVSIDKNVEYQPANVSDAPSIVLRNGRIYFGEDSNVECSVDGITASDFNILKIENEL